MIYSSQVNKMVDVKKIPAYATGYEWLGSSRRHGSYGVMIFLGLIVHIIQIIRYWFDIYDRDVAYYAIHTALFIIFLILIDKSDKNIYAIWAAYMLLPTIVYHFRDMLTHNISTLFAGKIGKSFIGLYLSTFMYPLWLLYGCSKSESRGAKIFFDIYFIVAAIFFVGAMIEMPSFARAAGFLGRETGVPVEPRTIYEGVKEIYDKTRDFITQTPTRIREGWERQIEYATGGYYEGKVEENVREPLGVYLENLKGAETEFDDEEEVIVWGTLKARTLDEKEPIDISLSCVADKDEKNRGMSGDIIPSTLKKFEIKTFEEEDFSCKFPKGKLEAGSHNIKLLAEFNFKTMAYLKTYFMDQERRRAMVREGIDILNKYGITDAAPTATFTNGPVKIGAETTKSLPVGVDKEGGEGKTVRLGVTIENQWQGKIKEIKDVIIEIPDSMTIDSCDVESNDKKDEDEGSIKDVGYKRYSINLSGERFTNIKTFKSFNCILKVVDKEKLLGTTPIATRYYRITAKYIYELESGISVSVKGEEREQIEPDGSFIPSKQWHKVKATQFSAKDKGAYGGSYSDYDLYAALPSDLRNDKNRGAIERMIEVRYNDKSVRVPVVSIGPWFIDDDYWNKDGIPFAEKNINKYRNSLNIGDGVSDTPTKYDDKQINGAGIDLSEGVFKELGISGTSAEVKWRFISKQIPVFEIWPVEVNSLNDITSDYGYRILNGKRDFHDGIDIGVAKGTPVKSVADGTVEFICDEEDCSGYGKNIIIKHSDTLYTRYNHLSKIKVKGGDTVNKGDVIAESGDTGVSTGPHLDFKVYTSYDFGKDKGVDPIYYLPSIG